jgi:thiosulfate/3-mercaptopyruvate sulfurtransferase
VAHQKHRDLLGRWKLSCQVCHAGPYKQCYECHVTLDEGGLGVYEVNAPSHVGPIGTHVGRNPLKGGLHPEEWVTVRHFPAVPDAFAFYGNGLLPAFDARPTWGLATPHTIVANTPQNADCATSCHGKRELFVGPDELKDYETAANAGVVVATPPGP